MKREIAYLTDLALFFGVSEASIRGYIQRRAYPESIPTPFKIGVKNAWKIEDLQKWLDEKSSQKKKKTTETKVKRGRPRKSLKQRNN